MTRFSVDVKNNKEMNSNLVDIFFEKKKKKRFTPIITFCWNSFCSSFRFFFFFSVFVLFSACQLYWVQIFDDSTFGIFQIKFHERKVNFVGRKKKHKHTHSKNKKQTQQNEMSQEQKLSRKNLNALSTAMNPNECN